LSSSTHETSTRLKSVLRFTSYSSTAMSTG